MLAIWVSTCVYNLKSILRLQRLQNVRIYNRECRAVACYSPTTVPLNSSGAKCVVPSLLGSRVNAASDTEYSRHIQF